MAHRPPNILLVHSDQHRYDCVGANGHPLVRTPNLDRLAAEGVNFRHAFSTVPICSPARASLLTGAWPHAHGCVSIPRTEAFRPADPALPTLTALLHDAGYWVGHVGKFHQEVHGSLLDYGVDEFVNAWDYAAWRQGRGIPPVPRDNGFFGEADPHVTAADCRLGWMTDAVTAMLAKRVADGRPFFLRFDPPEPHLPNVLPEPYASMYDPRSIPPWASFPDPLIGKPYAQRRQRADWGVEDWTWACWAPIVARYLGEVTLLDHHLGRALDALDRLGLAGDTLVLYTSDHGDMCGGHGTMDKHFNMYDDIMRVPLIARWPGRIGRGVADDGFVSQEIDIAATIADAAGVDRPPTFTGRALFGDAPPRHDIYAAYFGTEAGLYSQRMVRDAAWKLVYNATAEDELYHLAADPAELHNRVDDPTCRHDLNRLRQRLAEWMREVGDPLYNRWTLRRLGLATALSERHSCMAAPSRLP